MGDGQVTIVFALSSGIEIKPLLKKYSQPNSGNSQTIKFNNEQASLA